MRTLRIVQLAALVMGLSAGASNAHAIINLDLEAGGGLALRGAQSPMATGRAAVNLLSLLDVGLRGQYVFGADPTTAGNKGYQGYSVFPELRLKTPTPVVQFDLALGGGLGYLKGITLDKGVDANGAAKPFGQVGVGFRLKIPTTDVYLRLEGSVSIYTSVAGPDIGDGLNPGLLPVYQVQLTIGYTGIGF